jgi:hypothetical protein
MSKAISFYREITPPLMDIIKKDTLDEIKEFVADNINEDNISRENIDTDSITIDNLNIFNTNTDILNKDNIKTHDIKTKVPNVDNIKSVSVKVDNLKIDSLNTESLKSDSTKIDIPYVDRLKLDLVKIDSIKKDNLTNDNKKEGELKPIKRFSPAVVPKPHRESVQSRAIRMALDAALGNEEEVIINQQALMREIGVSHATWQKYISQLRKSDYELERRRYETILRRRQKVNAAEI